MEKIIVLAIILAYVSPAVKGQYSAQQITIENHLKSFPNGEVAIGVIDEKQEYKFGYKILEGNLKRIDNSSTLFEIGSITKTFVASLLAKEISKGNVSLEDPIQKHLNFKIKSSHFKDQTIRMWHLATHTSGLKRNPLVSYKKYTKYLGNFELDYVPGGNWEYNNMTVALLGEVVAQKNKVTWDVLLKQNLLLPLGMSSTYVSIQEAPMGNRVKCIKKSGRTNDCYFHKMGTFQWPSGSMISTLDDMMKWLGTNLHKSKIKPELEFISITHDPTKYDISIPWFEIYNAKQGIVWWHFKTDNGNKIICHGGNMPAQTSFIAFDEVTKRGVVILTNNNTKSLMNDNKTNKLIELALKILDLSS